MTAADLATYGHALANGQLFQKPNTLAEMLDFNPDALLQLGATYGLGLMDFAGDGTTWGHEGATLAFQSLWYTDPEAGILVVGLTNSGSYNGMNFLNVRNIINGDGAKPLGPGTLLPAGYFAPTTWNWTEFTSPAELIEIDETAGLQLVTAKDQSVTVNSVECGSAFGTYTTDSSGNISFEIDPYDATCAADAMAGKFWQYLKDAVKWHFDNGRLVIELPVDGGLMVFEQVPLE